jgi:hypothetical protein
MNMKTTPTIHPSTSANECFSYFTNICESFVPVQDRRDHLESIGNRRVCDNLPVTPGLVVVTFGVDFDPSVADHLNSTINAHSKALNLDSELAIAVQRGQCL